MDRRGFCALVVAAPAGFLAACASVRSVPFALEPGGVSLAVSSLDAEGRAVVAGEPLPAAVLVQRRPDGTYRAVSLRCTHRGCRVAPAGDRLACPCHGSEFTFEGEVLEGPASRPLARHSVELHGERLIVGLQPLQ